MRTAIRWLFTIECPRCGTRFSSFWRPISEWRQPWPRCPDCGARMERTNSETWMAVWFGFLVLFFVVPDILHHFWGDFAAVIGMAVVFVALLTAMALSSRHSGWRVIPEGFQEPPQARRWRRLALWSLWLGTVVAWAPLVLLYCYTMRDSQVVYNGPLGEAVKLADRLSAATRLDRNVSPIIILIAFLIFTACMIKYGRTRIAAMENYMMRQGEGDPSPAGASSLGE